jgi:hypothetical protein
MIPRGSSRDEAPVRDVCWSRAESKTFIWLQDELQLAARRRWQELSWLIKVWLDGRLDEGQCRTRGAACGGNCAQRSHGQSVTRGEDHREDALYAGSQVFLSLVR